MATWLLLRDDDSGPSTSAAETSSTTPVTSEYTYSEPASTTDPYETTDTYEPPETTTTTYEPPPEYWGALAMPEPGGGGHGGRAYNAKSESAAESKAMSYCTGSGCKVLVTFKNSCGAIVQNQSTYTEWGGRGSSPKKAIANARENAGGGKTLDWVCTSGR